MAAAWKLHLKIRRATIVPSDDFAGIIEHESPLRGINLAINSSDRAETKTDKAMLICLAGPIAQRRSAPNHGAVIMGVATTSLHQISPSDGTAQVRWPAPT